MIGLGALNAGGGFGVDIKMMTAAALVVLGGDDGDSVANNFSSILWTNDKEIQVCHSTAYYYHIAEGCSIKFNFRLSCFPQCHVHCTIWNDAVILLNTIRPNRVDS